MILMAIVAAIAESDREEGWYSDPYEGTTPHRPEPLPESDSPVGRISVVLMKRIRRGLTSGRSMWRRTLRHGPVAPRLTLWGITTPLRHRRLKLTGQTSCSSQVATGELPER
jgi:hypothetical protein